MKTNQPILSTVQFIAEYVNGLRPCPADTDFSTTNKTLQDVDKLFIWSNGDLEDSSGTGTAPVLKVDTHDVATTYENNKSELLETNNN